MRTKVLPIELIEYEEGRLEKLKNMWEKIGMGMQSILLKVKSK